MEEYSLKLLRSSEILENRAAAIDLLNAYNRHAIGQPVMLYYKDTDNSVKALFAVGKKNYNETTGTDHGPDFYDIINVSYVYNYYTDACKWRKIKD